MRDQGILPIEFELHALRGGLRGGELRARLLDGRFLGGNLVRDACDGRFLGRDFPARRINRELIVAVVDGGDHVAGVNVGVVLDGNRGEIAGDLGGERRVVRSHVGIVGRDHEPADRPPVVAVGPTSPERQQRERDECEPAQLR